MKPTIAVNNTGPRTMSRDDRKLIFAEIEGCYDKEAKRYMDGWHDERVAKALGAHVPKAWVTEVREDFFGASGSNQQFDEFAAQIAQVAEAEEKLRKMVAAANAEVESLQKRIEPLTRLARDVQKAIA